jgi:hypothetical protein
MSVSGTPFFFVNIPITGEYSAVVDGKKQAYPCQGSGFKQTDSKGKMVIGTFLDLSQPVIISSDDMEQPSRVFITIIGRAVPVIN